MICSLREGMYLLIQIRLCMYARLVQQLALQYGNWSINVCIRRSLVLENIVILILLTKLHSLIDLSRNLLNYNTLNLKLWMQADMKEFQNSNRNREKASTREMLSLMGLMTYHFIIYVKEHDYLRTSSKENVSIYICIVKVE